MNLRDYKSVPDRRKALEKELGTPLSLIGSSSLDTVLASSHNCENMIGFIQVPVGVAGPIKIKDPHFAEASRGKQGLRIKDYYIPLSTTEGALIASVSRGCKAIAESGAVTVISKKIGISRAPVFAVENILQGKEFMENCEKHFKEFKKIAESTSSHLTLLSIKSYMAGRNVFLRFLYDTKDAMGMNMATIATASIVSHIEKKTAIKCIALSGNMCADKKSNYLNFIEGRGFSVWADAVISKEAIKNTLKTTSEKIYQVWNSKVVHGSIMSGSIGANAHAANVLAGIFLATGQDIAHISEVSSVITSIEMQEEGLYISVYLPDLPVGIVGGGTQLAVQKEALSILKVNSSEEFAGIIAAAVLAGELSLLASLAEGTLSLSHQKLARGIKQLNMQISK